MQKLITVLVIFCCMLAIGSCRKEYDQHDPEIVFLKPELGFTINLPDTLQVKVEISDDRIIRNVTLTLVNEDKIPVMISRQFYPDNPEFQIETSMVLDDKTMASGTYYLQIIATDGYNSRNKYQQIAINEIPREIRSYIAITGQFDYQSTIVRLSPAFETDTQFVISEEYHLSGVNSLWGKFFFVTGEPSSIIAINPESFETEWEMTAGQPRPLITAIFPDQGLVFSTANGDAGVLSKDGIIILKTPPIENKTIQCLAADDNYIYAEHVSLSGEIHELTVYYRATGSIREKKILTGEINSLVPVADKVLVFMQSQAGTAILEYDPVTMTLAQISFLQSEVVRSAVKISEHQIVLVTDSRVIIFEPAVSSFTVFTNQTYDFCRYDPVTDIIFLVRENIVYGFDRVKGDLWEEKSFPEEVLDFQILYNK